MGKLTAQYEDRLATRERNTVKKQTTRNQIDRLVEDLITESMANGEFDNLDGAGKPLPNRVDYNPYTDFTTHKINQIMVETGFAPEWVQLQKDIREAKEKLRDERKKTRQKLGPAPLSEKKHDIWMAYCERLRNDEVRTINKMIEKFNLIVPNMNNQLFQYKFETDVDKIFNMTISPARKTKPNGSDVSIKRKEPSENLFSGIFNFLNK